MRKLTPFFAVALLLVLAFVWGFLAHRNQIFPYSIVRAWREASADERLLERGEGAFPTAETALEDLQTLGYTAGTVADDPNTVGVVEHDVERAWAGVNFFVSRGLDAAFLIDMDGEVLYQWRYESRRPWEAAELLPGGELLLIVPDVEMVKLSADSKEIWRRSARYHHQPILHDGKIYVLERRVVSRPEVRGEGDVYDDLLVQMDLEGNIEQETSMMDLVVDSPLFGLLPSPDGFAEFEGPVELVHANNVQIFDGRLADLSPLFEQGHLLLSFRNLNTVLIYDPEQNEVVWFWGPNNVTQQHDPELLDSGNILLFNNGTEQSELVEIDPRSGRVVWRFTEEGFHSRTRGSVQRLPNGNSLVTESNQGRVFEVSEQGDLVWAFEGPIVDPDEALRGAIWRMTRYPESSLDFLE